ncbi:DUF2784 domain-containing protein [Porticoccus sp. W117]|uniref:DUF2784 domain-containing protein n=1 Tax=Porticoccus sp. W117 TaxID=3054777 RepID=UPI0025981088|nr:DUF2784 domain-containing protein [Porticoccus sp. W117]MDM3870562.1 DUF2784 domain-containing protein [Porticoccus sp. W117]
MIYNLLADLVVVFHLLFIVFVIVGALLVLRWRSVMWLHLPAVVWVAILEFNSLICPLTPLENHLRQAAGQAGYQGGFIEHYLIPIIYPSGLTPNIQMLLGIAVLAINVLIYTVLACRWRRGK